MTTAPMLEQLTARLAAAGVVAAADEARQLAAAAGADRMLLGQLAELLLLELGGQLDGLADDLRLHGYAEVSRWSMTTAKCAASRRRSQGFRLAR